MTAVNFTTVAQAFPQGTVAGTYFVQILNSTGASAESMNVSGTSAVFTQTLPPGTYTATVQLMDINNAPLGPLVTSDPFTIEAPAPVPIDLAVPASITVTV